MKNFTGIISVMVIFSGCSATKQSAIQDNMKNSFVKVQGTRFIINEKPYYFVGANFWAGMNLGSKGIAGNRERLLRELNKMQYLGINNLRIMALTEGPETEPYRIIPSNNNKGKLDENLLQGLDFLLVEMQKRKMYAVVCLSNFWPWSGGFAQYQKWVGDIKNIDYPMDTTKVQDWDLYMNNTAKFYSSPKAVSLYKDCIAKIINRKNSITNTLYKNDSTIMSWELCNEPRGMKNVNDYLQWINNTAQYIKGLDANHLVTVGSEGLDQWKEFNGTPFIETHNSPYVDYTCIHLWAQNWNWYHPKKHNETYDSAKKQVAGYISSHIALAKKLNKPFVLEEFGIGRDNDSYNPASTTLVRDDYYAFVFNLVYNYAKQGQAAGINFWAWAGEGRPRNAACWWKKGDDFTGDPPHELQGWYSVYNSDTLTLKVIKEYAEKMNALK